MLDFTVVTLGYMEFIGSGNYTAVRSVRVLRPLRAITKIEKMRVGGRGGRVRQSGSGAKKCGLATAATCGHRG